MCAKDGDGPVNLPDAIGDAIRYRRPNSETSVGGPGFAHAQGVKSLPMSRWQRHLGIALLLGAAIVMVFYEFSLLGTQPAVAIALLLGIIGGSTLGSARKSGSTAP